MKGLETLEEQRLLLKAMGNVLANEHIELVPGTFCIEYGTYDSAVFHLMIEFDSLVTSHIGQKINNEYKKLNETRQGNDFK